MAETAALSPQYLKQLREEREARLAAKKGDGDVIEIESNSDSDEVQLIASPPKRKRADDDDEVQFLPSPPKRSSTGGTLTLRVATTSGSFATRTLSRVEAPTRPLTRVAMLCTIQTM